MHNVKMYVQLPIYGGFMISAIEQAHAAALRGEVPVGAVVCKDNVIIAAAHNLTITNKDPCAHAELLAIRQAAKALNSLRLEGCSMYVTLEPCPMCAHALSLARVSALYFGASDIKGGGVENGPRIFSQPTCFHIPQVFGGIMEEECSKLLKDFFKALRS